MNYDIRICDCFWTIFFSSSPVTRVQCDLAERIATGSLPPVDHSKSYVIQITYPAITGRYHFTWLYQFPVPVDAIKDVDTRVSPVSRPSSVPQRMSDRSVVCSASNNFLRNFWWHSTRTTKSSRFIFNHSTRNLLITVPSSETDRLQYTREILGRL